MDIRQYEAEHLQQCTEMFVRVFNAAPWHDEWTLDKAQAYLAEFVATPGFLGLLAIEDEQIVGLLFGVRRTWWSGDEFYIHELCVDAQRQHGGIGTALLKAVEQRLDADVHNITLLTDRGIPAEAFYKKHGFEEIERLLFLCKSLK